MLFFWEYLFVFQTVFGAQSSTSKSTLCDSRIRHKKHDCCGPSEQSNTHINTHTHLHTHMSTLLFICLNICVCTYLCVSFICVHAHAQALVDENYAHHFGTARYSAFLFLFIFHLESVPSCLFLFLLLVFVFRSFFFREKEVYSERLKGSFYVQTNEWRARIVHRGLLVILQVRLLTTFHISLSIIIICCSSGLIFLTFDLRFFESIVAG